MKAPPPCPFLPPEEADLDFRVLQRHGSARGPAFYLDALRYGQVLWRQGHAGRALLAVTRGLYANVPAEAAVLRDWPLPYAALRWMVETHPSDDFPGNPRVSYQHQASRLRGPRQAQRAARAWGVWALVRVARPTLPGDPTQRLTEPTRGAIYDGLKTHGHPGEGELWAGVMAGAAGEGLPPPGRSGNWGQ
jgi:hypothetical protein